MLKSFRRRLQDWLLAVEGLFDYPFGPKWNPMRQLGTLSFFFYWVVAVSGIYVFVFFDTTVKGAYESVEYMTVQQWYLAGVMRSIHRYASDAMVVTTVFHLLREFITDRYRGVRWFTWFTGVPILWFLYVSGVSGYWLVWDQLAQYVAIGSMEWLDWLGIFGEPIANNFLKPGSLSDRFFTLLFFMHIFAPLFLLFIMWIHLLKLNRPQVNPPRGLAFGCLLALVALSLAKPAMSHAPADLATMPTVLSLDWFYLFAYPFFDEWGPGATWALAFGASLLVAFLPWLPPLKHGAAAQVVPEKCNGCTRCFEDCPFAAISMQPRDDGRPFERIARVDPRYCTSCGMCVGSCPVSTPFRRTGELVTGIELPDLRLHALRAATDAALRKAAESATATAGGGAPAVLVVGCDHGCEIDEVEGQGIATVKVPCVGMLPPSFIDYAFSRGGADGVMLHGCREGDCYHRLGIRWTQERLDGMRDPYLRERVSRERIRTCWISHNEGRRLRREVDAFRADLQKLPAPDQADKKNDAA
ncbi:MAG: hydrogenase iron-sulfur subunit [Hyphomicrobiales bacterium]|nr:hydrogenase iron-sulfur subunit [Hyphomicrobiales bacterium]